MSDEKPIEIAMLPGETKPIVRMKRIERDEDPDDRFDDVKKLVEDFDPVESDPAYSFPSPWLPKYNGEHEPVFVGISNEGRSFNFELNLNPEAAAKMIEVLKVPPSEVHQHRTLQASTVHLSPLEWNPRGEVSMSVDTSDRKYRYVTFTEDWRVFVYRHGEAWLVVGSGGKALIELMHDVEELRERLSKTGIKIEGPND